MYVEVPYVYGKHKQKQKKPVDPFKTRKALRVHTVQTHSTFTVLSAVFK